MRGWKVGRQSVNRLRSVKDTPGTCQVSKRFLGQQKAVFRCIFLTALIRDHRLHDKITIEEKHSGTGYAQAL